MAPPKKPHGDGNDGNEGDPDRPGDGDGDNGDESPSQEFDGIDAGKGVTSAQVQIGKAADAGTPKQGATPGKGDDKDGNDGNGDDPDDRPGDPDDGQDPFDALTPEEQRAAIDELIADSNPNFPLTEATAEAILRSGPPGTKPVVGGPSAEGADTRFVDADGNEVARIENKSIAGGPNAFNRQMGHAAGQVDYDGTVAVQVKPGTDPLDWMHKFTGNRTDEQLARFENVDVVFYDENGNVIGNYNAGTRPPRRGA